MHPMTEASRPTLRRTSSRSTQPTTRNASIEGWIFDEERKSKFITFWKDKPLITPKFIKSQWFTNRAFMIPTLLAEQGVKFFAKMQGAFYPDLTRVFYYNYRFRDGVCFKKVKAVDILLTMISGKMLPSFQFMTTLFLF